ncbi:VanZ family protein [Lacunimicrobium album]
MKSLMMSNRFWALLTMLVTYWMVLLYATHMPVEYVESVEVSDKFMHVAAYAVLSFLLASTLHCLNWRFRAIVPTVLLTTMIYGGIDETTQPWFGRVADIVDWSADQAGGVLGIILYLVATATVRSLRKLIMPQPAIEAS